MPEPLTMPVPGGCRACGYCGIEPSDMDFVCGHPDAGTFGLYIRTEPLAHCGWKKFEQHPGRNPDGTLKGVSL